MADRSYNFLTAEQVDHFMTYGWVRIPEAFTQKQADEWTKDLWLRLGYDKDDKSTWVMEKVNMPGHNSIDAGEFSPKAWGAICELTGGEERIDPISRKWLDAFIVNLGSESSKGKPVAPRDLDNWHVDGDFFTHFLDSPEQGLLVIPVLSPIAEHGGGTFICPDGIGVVARHLHDNPDGVTPYMARRGEEKELAEYSWFVDQARDPSKCNLFQEMTGDVGDVILLHPFMMHSASKNALHTPRIITNPSIYMKEPFNFNRPDPKDYSLVESKILRELGVDSLPDWHITGERKRTQPGRVDIHNRMREIEKRRLAGENLGGTGDTGVEVQRELVKDLFVPLEKKVNPVSV
ncbi:Clavaminate synthase-like protein [Sarocladium implicatum]|nr:Clavaminate synthase-like protein [Sarocladium implicatum]